MAHFAYFVKDLVFYVLLILSPIIVGMGLGKGLDTFFGITTPLEYSSLPWTWFAMVVTLAQGLAISFLASALWMRGRPFTIFGPAERMCNRMAIINDGKVLAAGTVRGLKQNSEETLEDVFIRLVGKSIEDVEKLFEQEAIEEE